MIQICQYYLWLFSYSPVNFLNPTHRIMAALAFGGMSSEFIYFIFQTSSFASIGNAYADVFVKCKFLCMTSELHTSDVVSTKNKVFVFFFLSIFLSAVLGLILNILLIAMLYYPFFACMDAPVSLVGYCMGSFYCDL